MPSTLASDAASRPARWSIDQLGIWLSGLCAAHCIATMAFVGVAASAGLLLEPAIHRIGLVAAVVLGAVAFGRGMLVHRLPLPSLVGAAGLAAMAAALFLPHGLWESIATLGGVALVAWSHALNSRAVRARS